MSDAFKKSTYFRSRKTILPLIAVITMLATLFTGFFAGKAEGEDEIPVDQTLLRRGKDYFSAYFEGWLTYTNEYTANAAYPGTKFI